MAPKDENELQHMLYTATIAQAPVAIRYPRGSGSGVPLDECLTEIPIGTAEILSSGKDIMFLAVGAMVEQCQEARLRLAAIGIQAGVVNARFIKPLDEKTIRELVREVGILVTVEDNVVAGGFGSAVLEYINAQQFNWVKVLRLGLPDQFIEHGTRMDLLKQNGLTGEEISKQVMAFMKQYGVR